MTAEVLSSNVVNYLVWRYLQEAGYASAAIHLSRKWHQQPQNLPFAGTVRPHALIEMLSDGFWYDQLQATHSKNERRYPFGNDHGSAFPVPSHTRLVDTPDPEIDRTNKPNRKRPRDVSGETRSERPTTKQKRFSGNRLPQDEMDVDDPNEQPVTNGVASANDSKEPEQAVSDVESPLIEEVPLPTTLGLGQSSGGQSLPEIADYTRQTAFVKVSNLTKEISSIAWRPGKDEKSLLVTGDQLIRDFEIPLASDNRGQSDQETPPEPVLRAEPELPLKPFNITCATYISTSTAVVAVDQERPPNTNAEEGFDQTQSKIFLLDQGLKRHRLAMSVTGTVLQMRWNSASRRLLCVSSTGDGGSGCLSVFSASTEPNGSEESEISLEDLVMTITPRAVWDAIWTGDSSFTVVGQELVREYELVLSEGIKMRAEYPTEATWEKVRYDPRTKIAALAPVRDDATHALGLLIPGSEPESPKELMTHATGDDDICEIAFQPLPESHEQSNREERPCVLAACSDGGLVTLWNAKKPFELLTKLSMEQVPALTLAWDPSGDRLAVGGLDEVRVWRINSTSAGDSANSNGSVRGQLLGKWKWGTETNGNGVGEKLTNGHKESSSEDVAPKETNGDVEMGEADKDMSKVVWDISLSDRDLEFEHDLSWDNDGTRIAFTVSNQIAIIDTRS